MNFTMGQWLFYGGLAGMAITAIIGLIVTIVLYDSAVRAKMLPYGVTFLGSIDINFNGVTLFAQENEEYSKVLSMGNETGSSSSDDTTGDFKAWDKAHFTNYFETASSNDLLNGTSKRQ
ncbi:hypothetical protein LQZ18_00410 [Lachnospiraceae bacterium ZAX-1]